MLLCWEPSTTLLQEEILKCDISIFFIIFGTVSNSFKSVISADKEQSQSSNLRPDDCFLSLFGISTAPVLQ